jgi:hypothetical protein
MPSSCHGVDGVDMDVIAILIALAAFALLLALIEGLDRV